jgi:hypothetical protein
LDKQKEGKLKPHLQLYQKHVDSLFVLNSFKDVYFICDLKEKHKQLEGVQDVLNLFLPHLTSVCFHSLDLLLGLLQSNLKLFHKVITYASSAGT